MKKLIEIFYDSSNKQDGQKADIAFFLSELEKTIADDLWKSAGGHWSKDSILFFREEAMRQLVNEFSNGNVEILNAWQNVVRSFHAKQKSKYYWGQQALLVKEKVPLSSDQKNSRKLFMYIWAMMQTAIVTKTAIMYFGLKSAEEQTTEGKIYVSLAIASTVVSLTYFAFKHYGDEGKS